MFFDEKALVARTQLERLQILAPRFDSGRGLQPEIIEVFGFAEPQNFTPKSNLGTRQGHTGSVPDQESPSPAGRRPVTNAEIFSVGDAP
jgi:hypothetical protein